MAKTYTALGLMSGTSGDGVDASIIKSDVWMKYFGIFPDDPKMRIDHWINVARFRYPLMPIKPDNYEAILAACYLHDKEKNESIGAFA